MLRTLRKPSSFWDMQTYKDGQRMGMTRFLAVRRDDIYSPNSVEKDRLILKRVCDQLKTMAQLDQPIRMIDEAELAAVEVEADCIVTMARSDAALQRLLDLERRGCKVVNTPEGVGRCQRSVLDKLMRKSGICMPPLTGEDGYWLKRGDAAAQSKDDVVFCEDAHELRHAQNSFRHRGITNFVVSAHVPGDLVKFYGVGNRMFHYFYPSDDGISKFGDELRNGKAHHFSFDVSALRAEVMKLAHLTGVEVYGGDVIIGHDGRFYIVDFNDWPSFSRCSEEAAEAIARQVLMK